MGNKASKSSLPHRRNDITCTDTQWTSLKKLKLSSWPPLPLSPINDNIFFCVGYDCIYTYHINKNKWNKLVRYPKNISILTPYGPDYLCHSYAYIKQTNTIYIIQNQMLGNLQNCFNLITYNLKTKKWKKMQPPIFSFTNMNVIKTIINHLPHCIIIENELHLLLIQFEHGGRYTNSIYHFKWNEKTETFIQLHRLNIRHREREFGIIMLKAKNLLYFITGTMINWQYDILNDKWSKHGSMSLACPILDEYPPNYNCCVVTMDEQYIIWLSGPMGYYRNDSKVMEQMDESVAKSHINCLVLYDLRNDKLYSTNIKYPRSLIQRKAIMMNNDASSELLANGFIRRYGGILSREVVYIIAKMSVNEWIYMINGYGNMDRLDINFVLESGINELPAEHFLDKILQYAQ
eukprot:154712_1